MPYFSRLYAHRMPAKAENMSEPKGRRCRLD
jgi:hypothetical protein